MGKQGPCRHCGIQSTPLWRNGPPEKPVLCNACGSRWRTKGSLANYTPVHCRRIIGHDFDKLKTENSEDYKFKVPSKRKPWHQKEGASWNDVSEQECGAFSTGTDADTTTHSSSRSGISISGSCTQLASIDGNENKGCAQSSSWDFNVPSRKRTSTKCNGPSLVEELQRDLLSVLQAEEYSDLSDCREDLLYFDRKCPPFSPEVGLGSVLIKTPPLLAEEESEGSSAISKSSKSCLSDDHVAPSVFRASSQSSEISSNLGPDDCYTANSHTSTKSLEKFEVPNQQSRFPAE